MVLSLCSICFADANVLTGEMGPTFLFRLETQFASLTLGLQKTYMAYHSDAIPDSIRHHANRQRPCHQWYIAQPDSPLTSDLHDCADRYHPFMVLLLLERRFCLRKRIPSC